MAPWDQAIQFNITHPVQMPGGPCAYQHMIEVTLPTIQKAIAFIEKTEIYDWSVTKYHCSNTNDTSIARATHSF